MSIIAAVLLTSCKQSQLLPLSMESHDGLKFSGVSLKGAKGKVNVTIKNPNPVAVKVYRSKFDVEINDASIGKAKTRRHLVIPANSEVQESLYLKSKFSNLGISGIPALVKTIKSKNMNLAINGDLKTGKPFNKATSPIALKDTINMQEKTKPIVNFISKVGEKSKQLISKAKSKDECKE